MTIAKNKLFRHLLMCISSGLLLFAATPSPAYKLSNPNTPDQWLDLRLLMQPAAQLRYDPTLRPDFVNDYYLRRARIILGGQLSRYIGFFFDTDAPNLGKGGNWTSNDFQVLDAYGSLTLHEGFQIYAGLLLVPFIHNAAQSAGNLHTLDYHSDLIRYPKGATKGWRDAGIMVRGLLASKKVDYRLMISNGVPDNLTVWESADKTSSILSRTNDSPRFSGRLAFNVFDAEEGFFLGGTYLGQKKILSLGIAGDYQSGVFGAADDVWTYGQYYAIGADIFLDLPLANNRRVSGQVAFVNYGGRQNPDRGLGLLGDIGYAFGKWEPVLGVDWYYPRGSEDFDAQLLGVHPGLNWWFMDHTANLKFDLGFVKPKGYKSSKMTTVGTLQGQIFF